MAEEAYAKGKATYDKLSQIIANPGVYLENVVAPVCEILSAYPEAVLSVDVLSNPEDEIYETGKIYGTTWDVVRNFIKANAEAVKKALPNVPVMASSADRAQAAVKAGLLNNLGLDIVGVTNYSDSGSVTPAKDFRSPSPLWVVDMGCLLYTSFLLRCARVFAGQCLFRFFRGQHGDARPAQQCHPRDQELLYG